MVPKSAMVPKLNPSHPDMAEGEMPPEIVPTDVLLGMLTASHVGLMKQRWVEWTRGFCPFL